MFLDIGGGILLSFLVTWLFGININVNIIFLSVLFTLFPDVDLIFRKHRSITHYPIIYFLIIPFIFLLLGGFWTTLIFSGVMFHLLHDTFFLGWGIKWFWPFSNRSFKFFPDKNGKITSQILLSWDHKEEKEIRKEYGTKRWIKEFYLKPNIVSIIGYSVFVISLIFLFVYFYG